jgi:hypothetical protein
MKIHERIGDLVEQLLEIRDCLHDGRLSTDPKLKFIEQKQALAALEKARSELFGLIARLEREMVE